MDEHKPQYWAVLPAAVRYDAALPPNAKLLYAEISALTDKRGYCFASNSYFEQLYSLSERTVSRLLARLDAAGYIRILDADGGGAVRKIYAGLNPVGAAAQGIDKNVYTPRQKCLGGIDKNDGALKDNQDNLSSPPVAPQGAGADFVPKKAPDWKPDRFNRFWQFYPTKKSKQATIRAWDRLKPSDELLAVIGRALESQIAESKRKAEKERRPWEWKLHASTYLNQARWTDETEHQGEGPGAAAEVEAIPWG